MDCFEPELVRPSICCFLTPFSMQSLSLDFHTPYGEEFNRRESDRGDQETRTSFSMNNFQVMFSERDDDCLVTHV